MESYAPFPKVGVRAIADMFLNMYMYLNKYMFLFKNTHNIIILPSDRGV